MVKVQKMNPIVLTVADIERSQDFYTRALGFKAVGDITLEESSLSKLASKNAWNGLSIIVPI